MRRIKFLAIWLIAFTLWLCGAGCLWKLWQFQKILPDPAASYIEFSVMFIATFYILALFPIKDFVHRVLFGIYELTDPVFES